MKQLALGIAILFLSLLLAACGASPTPTAVPLTATPVPTVTPTQAPTVTSSQLLTREPVPTPVRVPTSPPGTSSGHLHIVVNQYVGQSEADDRSDPFHPAKLLINEDRAPTPEFVLAQDDTSYFDAIGSPDGNWLADARSVRGVSGSAAPSAPPAQARLLRLVAVHEWT
ncbi:MAG TPA: hypothetical protein PKO09_16040 [Anaerolineae bacterium]|nr:hypothetical protein [Anaerolineae bacterium]